MASVAPELPVLVRDQAFENLYRHYVKDVYHYSLALLRNPADAEDVTQTTFLNAYRAWQRGQEIEKPRNWLIKIAHNVARTRYARSSRRVKEVPLDDHLEQLAVPEEERPNIEGVLRALGRLPFNQRAALVMRELEGRSYVEIADTIGVSVPAVETLIFRARKSLRLRASALRSLAAVPVPSSLAQLLGGGSTVAAGGGAFVGTGLLVKATIALLAGAVVTGIGGNQIRPATATADFVRPVAPGRVAAFTGQPVKVRAAPGTTVRRGIVATARGVASTAHAVASRPMSPAAGARRGPTPSSTDLGLPAPPPLTTTVATTLPAVETVENTVPAVTGAVAAVVSSLPAAPELPSLPKLP